MAIIISTSKQKQQFGNNKVITIGSSVSDDFFVEGFDFELVLEFNELNNTYSVINNGGYAPLFKGKSFQSLTITKITRLLFENSQEFINFEVVIPVNINTTKKENYHSGFFPKKTIAQKDITKDNIENRRIAIINEVSGKITDLRKKLSQNNKAAIFSHFALFLSSFVCAFAVNNYICGLSIQESQDYLHLPTDIKFWVLYTILIFGVMLIFKQGIFGYFYSKSSGNQPKMAKSSQAFLITIPSLIMIGVYCFNLVYYLDYTKNIVFPILFSVFFTGITICIAIASGYYKSCGSELAELLNKYEYREDFEKVISEYRIWIADYVNKLSNAKKEYINDKIFKLRIIEFFEVIIGLCTAPFLAYGVSITLAHCFPEAAGWVRISGMLFSPVFLVLASCLIIFAFFLLVTSFSIARKIANSEVIKHDGFSNYLLHCAEIFGLEGTNKSKQEMKLGFLIAFCIIAIEFTMNVSYFSTEIGLDFGGLILSVISALVPTALLIAETYILGKTKFEIYALDSIKAKADN